MATNKRIVLGMTGASGAIYGLRLLDLLLRFSDAEIHLVCSPAWKTVASFEFGVDPTFDSDLGSVLVQAGKKIQSVYSFDSVFFSCSSFEKRIIVHAPEYFGASIASGSFPIDGMVVAPCSSSSLGNIANGTNRHLIHRAAEIQLKERRRLVLLFRESPYSLIHIENMRQITLSGGIVQAASPHFYASDFSNVLTTGNFIDSVLSRTLGLLGIEHDLPRWSGFNS